MTDIHFIDSHTGGEPTRLVVAGGPSLGSGPLSERRRLFAERFDGLRAAIIGEPRGHDAVVGALLCDPVEPDATAGIIFFNNAGMLGMCGHGTIGVAVSLFHAGRIGLGRHRFETPVGTVTAELIDSHTVRIGNVPSYRLLKDVTVTAPGAGLVTGDVAWGGNWFFLSHDAPCPLEARHLPRLIDAAEAVKLALAHHGVTGKGGAEIDHVEFFGKPAHGNADSRNFVLCPGRQYDRSPCGTGTSAKLACLAADGLLQPGDSWVQESIIGSRFTASYAAAPGGRIVPSITGSAYVCAEGRLIYAAGDPFIHGIAA